jgi:hypothetical protein
MRTRIARVIPAAVPIWVAVMMIVASSTADAPLVVRARAQTQGGIAGNVLLAFGPAD